MLTDETASRYKKNIEPWAPPEFQFTRDEILWGFNTLVTCGWGQQSGNGDKLMVPLMLNPKP